MCPYICSTSHRFVPCVRRSREQPKIKNLRNLVGYPVHTHGDKDAQIDKQASKRQLPDGAAICATIEKLNQSLPLYSAGRARIPRSPDLRLQWLHFIYFFFARCASRLFRLFSSAYSDPETALSTTLPVPTLLLGPAADDDKEESPGM